jgi:hypothetical protein
MFLFANNFEMLLNHHVALRQHSWFCCKNYRFLSEISWKQSYNFCSYVIFCFTQTLSSSFLYTFPSLCGCNHLSELKSRDDIPLLLGGGFDGIYSYLPMQLTDWPPVEVPLLFIGVTHISFDKNQFWHSRKRSIVFKTAISALRRRYSINKDDISRKNFRRRKILSR